MCSEGEKGGEHGSPSGSPSDFKMRTKNKKSPFFVVPVHSQSEVQWTNGVLNDPDSLMETSAGFCSLSRGSTS